MSSGTLLFIPTNNTLINHISARGGRRAAQLGKVLIIAAIPFHLLCEFAPETVN